MAEPTLTSTCIAFDREDAETLWVAVSMFLDEWEDKYVVGGASRGTMPWHIGRALELYEDIYDFIFEGD